MLSGAAYPTEYAGNEITPAGRRVDSSDIGRQRLVSREAVAVEHEGNRGIRIGDWKLVAEWDSPMGALQHP